MKKVCCITTILCFLFLSKNIFSQTLIISPHPNLPPYFFVVDKRNQLLYLIRKENRLQILKTVPCSTGAKQGDKLVEGDERTPEGIYFLTKKIIKLPNFELYGDIAYRTNYPNPIDKLFGKNGYGIWLHGRGKKLVPFDTKGCVAVASSNLKELKSYIQEDLTPLLIAEHIIFKLKDKSTLEEIKLLREKIEKWQWAWKDKSPFFFEFYDQHLFAKTSHKPFKHFVETKIHYFSTYKWIDIYIPEIFILKGPYYFVSYFYQYFRSPNFSSQGLKRLYWMKIKDEFKIVASEWKEKKLNLEKDYLREYKKRIISFLQTWKRAWETKNIEKYEQFYDLNAIQNNRKGIEAIIGHKRKIWKKNFPISIEIHDIDIKLCKHGFKITFIQKYEGGDHKDYGKKTLIIYPYKKSFKIEKERWKKI